MWPQVWLADPLFWTYGFLNCCLYFPFRPQKPFRVKKPRNFPFVMLWPIFVVPLRLNTLHNSRIDQNLLPLVGSAMCHLYLLFFLFFLEKLTKRLFLCFTLTSGGYLYFSIFQNAVIKCWWHQELSFLGLLRHCRFALC